MMRFLDKDLLILSDTDEGGEEPEDASAPLFYQPGKRGFYSPRQSRPGLERLNAFRNVGRLVYGVLFNYNSGNIFCQNSLHTSMNQISISSLGD